jgi:hypothetical protein
VTEIDLQRYGAGIFDCRGTLQSKRLDGERLLLLFGERHSLKPFIRETLLNALELDKLGVLSCVGVEGHPDKDIPGSEAKRAFEAMQAEHAGDDKKIVEGMLRAIRGHDFYFWKTLKLMRPNLVVQSVDDAALCNTAAGLAWARWCNDRQDCIRDRLRQSDLFQPSGLNPTDDDREREIQAKVDLQFEQEWAEAEINLARDSKMLNNLLELWKTSGTEKVAFLNAGSSHQWRIARQLPPDVSYYHIEQP